MGQFKIEITAMGGHGCQREYGDGKEVYGCRNFNCPDCLARELVETYLRKGTTVETATLTHWPGQKGEVQDNLLTRVRKGDFPK